jgi:hypothetical protein
LRAGHGTLTDPEMIELDQLLRKLALTCPE